MILVRQAGAQASSKTLRSAQVRRISWVRGVRPARERCEWPPHDTVLGRPPFRWLTYWSEQKCKGRPRAPFCMSTRGLLDLGFAKFHVLFCDGIVLLLHQFVGHRARILARHIIEASVGAGNQLDLDRGGFGHERTSFVCWGSN